MKKKTKIEEVLSVPTKVLETTLAIEKEIEGDISRQKPVKAMGRFWKTLGPGLTTGAADDDPSGIATYSQIGASRGFNLIWISLFTFPLMAVVQEMCARIGLVTKVGLAANIRRHYPKAVLYLCTFLLVFANVFNIGADLGAMAEGAKLIIPVLPTSGLIIFFAVFILVLQVLIPYKEYSKYLKYLTLVLLAYVFSALLVDVDWGVILSQLVVPKINWGKEEVLLVCAALGTTISPYLFFWQTSQEIEDAKERSGETLVTLGHPSRHALRSMRVDVWSGMLFSNIAMFFIITACAVTLYANGIMNIETAADAALALRPFAGESAFFLFAIGIIGTGLLAVPVLAGSAAYAVSEALGFSRSGFRSSIKEASAFYGVIILAILLGILMNFIGLHPIKALIYSAVLNGIISPLMLFLILRISSSDGIMGKYKNNILSNIVGWGAFAIMLIVSLISIGYLLV